MGVVAVGFGDAAHESQLTGGFSGLEEVELGQLCRDYVARRLLRNLFVGRNGALEITCATGFDAADEEPFAFGQSVGMAPRASEQRARFERLSR